MKEQLISFETAKLAKEKGFDIEVLNAYRSDGSIFSGAEGEDNDIYNHNLWDFYSAPTQSLLQRWLREKHNILIWLIPTHTDKSKLLFVSLVANDMPSEKGRIVYQSKSLEYEEALEIALQKGLEIIKGEIEEDEIDAIYFEISFTNNGFVNYANYITRYYLKSDSFKLFKKREDAKNYAILTKEKYEEYLKQSRNKKINELLNELKELLNK